jgi:hypothetical protein
MFSENSWLSKSGKISLVATFSVLWFSLFSVLSALLVSWSAKQFSFRDAILLRPQIQILVVLAIYVFLLTLLSLSLSDTTIEKKYKTWEKDYGKIWMGVLSIVSFIVLAVLFYFSFSLFYIYIINTFWKN